MTPKPTIWALFDSGGGSYQQAIQKYFLDQFDLYAVGIDIEKKHQNFLYCDLGSLSELFGKNEIFQTLDTLPKPDIILASPPCESWSVASSMDRGNNCWYTTGDTNFAIRTSKQIDFRNNMSPHFKRSHLKSVLNRLNGEACAYNLIRIIEHYNPKVWVIENPHQSRLWCYYQQICDFHGHKSLAHYYAYNKQAPKKPTIFYSNIPMKLKTTKEKSPYTIKHDKAKIMIHGYNNRSWIPPEVVKHVMEHINEHLQLQRITK